MVEQEQEQEQEQLPQPQPPLPLLPLLPLLPPLPPLPPLPLLPPLLPLAGELRLLHAAQAHRNPARQRRAAQLRHVRPGASVLTLTLTPVLCVRATRTGLLRAARTGGAGQPVRHRTYAARVPASGVPHAPRTAYRVPRTAYRVAHHRRARALGHQLGLVRRAPLVGQVSALGSVSKDGSSA